MRIVYTLLLSLNAQVVHSLIYHCEHIQRVHLDISIGEHAVDYAQIAAKEKLNELQLRIRQLLDQIEQITKEQAYQRVCNPLNFQYTSSQFELPLVRFVKSVSVKLVTVRMHEFFGGRWVRVLC